MEMILNYRNLRATFLFFLNPDASACEGLMSPAIVNSPEALSSEQMCHMCLN